MVWKVKHTEAFKEGGEMGTSTYTRVLFASTVDIILPTDVHN